MISVCIPLYISLFSASSGGFFFTQQNVPAEYEVKQTTSLLISQMVFTTAPSGAYILDTAYVWPVTWI